MGINLPKVSHLHRCSGGGGHDWEHKVYTCTADEEMLCPEHEPKS